MFVIRETAAYIEDLLEAGERLPYLRDGVERRLYPRLQHNPREGWYGRHQGRWHTRLNVLDTLLVIQASYTIEEDSGIVRMYSLDIVEETGAG